MNILVSKPHRSVFLALAIAGMVTGAAAQGCIIAHTTGAGAGGPQSQGGYLKPKHWQLTIGERHQYSFRHFVGDVEQVYREQNGSEVRNRINLLDANLTYQMTNRWSASLDIPVEFASRQYTIAAGVFRPFETDGHYATSGIGDIVLGVQRWMWDPTANPSHNVQLGLGLQMPTGNDAETNNLVITPGQPPVDALADYSIQPGTGAWGINFNWNSFQQMGPQTQAYFNGSYTAMLSQDNGVSANLPGFPPHPPQTAFVATSDEYVLQTGVAYSFKSINGLTLTFGPRDEGVPASNLLTGSEGWRRPGFAISLEPGLTWAFHGGNDVLSGSVARALYRDRTRSVPDKQLGTHGDAAFADYVWFASFTHRF